LKTFFLIHSLSIPSNYFECRLLDVVDKQTEKEERNRETKRAT
jgi:hypothetical protein